MTLERVAASKWTGVLNPTAQQDLRAFSTEPVKRYFSVLSRECRRADANHLNLGMCWAGIPPDWRSKA